MTSNLVRISDAAGAQVALDLVLHNHAGAAELNVPDAPQSLFLVLTNRAATAMRADAGATITLRFRPQTLRGIHLVALAPASLRHWAIDARPRRDSLTLVLQSGLVIEPGAPHTVHLQGVAAEPRGGTRATRVEAICDGFATTDVEMPPLHLLIHLAVRRAAIGAADRARAAAVVAIPAAGPFSARFTTGQGVLNGGIAQNRLVVELVNSSGRPVQLAGGDADTATRLVFDCQLGNQAAPPGLFAVHGDHMEVTDAPAGWINEGMVLRYAEQGSLPGGHLQEFSLEIETGAPSGTVALVVRVENLPEYDDAEMVLLTDIGPTVHNDDGIATVKPVALWGDEARIEFHPDHYIGAEGRAAADASLPSMGVTAQQTLQIAAQWLRVVDGRFGGTSVGVQRAGLSLRVDRQVATIRSEGMPLTINPDGQPVSIGKSELLGIWNWPPELTPALLLGGSMLIVGDSGAQLTLGRSAGPDDGMLQLGVSNKSASISSGDAPLRLGGGQVLIGDVAESAEGAPLTVGGPMRVVPAARPGGAAELRIDSTTGALLTMSAAATGTTLQSNRTLWINRAPASPTVPQRVLIGDVGLDEISGFSMETNAVAVAGPLGVLPTSPGSSEGAQIRIGYCTQGNGYGGNIPHDPTSLLLSASDSVDSSRLGLSYTSIQSVNGPLRINMLGDDLVFVQLEQLRLTSRFGVWRLEVYFDQGGGGYKIAYVKEPEPQ